MASETVADNQSMECSKSPHEAYPGFVERLQTALRFDGVTSPAEQVKHLAKVAGVTSTATKRWLQGCSKPRPATFVRLCRGLDVSFRWLATGEFRLEGPGTPDRWALIAGMPEWEIKVTHSWHKMTAWEKDKFQRYAFRLANKNPKALRLSAMYERGQISVHQLLGVM
ncbi:MAG: helix-turn-helix transcriptional regulator [Sulfuritalea sp.]|nr:helix-turn-helix transcriptional regulator [Sulfuritalea sp.]